MPRAVSAWKLDNTSAILTPPEVASLREVLLLGTATPPPVIAEVVVGLMELLECGEEIRVEPQ